MHPILWMKFMLDFVCMGFAKLRGTGKKRKLQNEIICLHRESNHRPFAFKPSALEHLAIGADNGLCLNSYNLKWHLMTPTRMSHSEIDIARCALELTVVQNLRFVLPMKMLSINFTERCINTQNHKQLDTCIVRHACWFHEIPLEIVSRFLTVCYLSR